METSRNKEKVKVDGRHARMERHKAQVITALVEYIRTHEEVPTTDVLADLAAVSRRSVFRLFEDRAALLRATSDDAYRRLSDQLTFPDVSTGTSEEILSSLVDYVAQVFEFITPFRRVTERATANRALIEAERARMQALFRDRVSEALAAVLPADALMSPIVRDSIRLALSWKAWDYLRSERRASVEHAKAVMLHTVHAVLRSARASV
ncbi:MAG: hypothetical protein U5J97_10500 [Trueperaceae bacterium]|nr:hypothetical protein [Trueperaceae bacterium]